MDEVVSSTTTNGTTKTVTPISDDTNKEAEGCPSQDSESSPLDEKNKSSPATEVRSSSYWYQCTYLPT